MIYISLKFYLFVILLLIIYYVFPLKYRWVTLLIGNGIFYWLFYKTGWWILSATIITSWITAIYISKFQGKRKGLFLFVGILLVIMPWFVIKNGNCFLHDLMNRAEISWIVPLGISFYTLQVISYLVDVYKGKIEPQGNLAKYALFVSFFPQLVQGPIPRYAQLEPQLVNGDAFDEKKVIRGFSFIIYGFFLKLVIADKAAVIVNMVFDNYPAYSGCYIWLASFLYSIQLYADFLVCTTLARGTALLFGIELMDNFRQPYLADSVKDFWRRWHISLSSWLRDYIYIPLGGNRKGKFRKQINLLLTFLFSGLWHGAGVKYIVWGGIHAFYQIGEDLIIDRKNVKIGKWGKRILIFFMVNFAWVIFRAESLRTGISMLKHMVTDLNPWILFNDRIFTLGLDWKEIAVLIAAIILLFYIDQKHERGFSFSEAIMQRSIPFRWLIYIGAIAGIMILGTYGYGFNAQDFIYGGF